MTIQHNIRKDQMILLFTLSPLAVAACSNQVIYESLQRAILQECEQQPIAQIEACMESNRMSYDEYRRELESLVIEQENAN